MSLAKVGEFRKDKRIRTGLRPGNETGRKNKYTKDHESRHNFHQRLEIPPKSSTMAISSLEGRKHILDFPRWPDTAISTILGYKPSPQHVNPMVDTMALFAVPFPWTCVTKVKGFSFIFIVDFDLGWTQGRGIIKRQYATGLNQIASNLRDRGSVKVLAFLTNFIFME